MRARSERPVVPEMINAFESTVRRNPERTCFTFVGASEGSRRIYSYRETRLLAASLARELSSRGVQRGESVVVDLPNHHALPFLLLAAGYGGFTLVMLNNRLSDSEKLSRTLELRRIPGETVRMTIDAAAIEPLMDAAMARLSGDAAGGRARRDGEGRAGRDGDGRTRRDGRTSFVTRADLAAVETRSTKALGRAKSGKDALRRRSEMALQDAVEEAVHFAEHNARMFDRNARAVVMFTSGTTGRSKAVPLTWRNLCSAAEASNASLSRRGEGLWQAALPLYHVGGLQILVRSFLNGTSFVLYERFDAGRLLADAARMGATHISVVDKMLHDLLAADDAGALSRYECILLGGGVLNPATVERVKERGLRVFASYGMTETSSQIANSLITPSFDGGLRLLPGCEARVVDPGEDGFGRLAVRAGGVPDGYLNARAVRTVDGFFLTGDTAALRGGLLYLKERTDDMFVSGGENVYPAEIAAKLLRLPGVADAYVFGAKDATWGRRPVAFVERERAAAVGAGAAGRRGLRADGEPSDVAFGEQLGKSLAVTLSKINQPKHVFVIDELPRKGVGKVDREAVQRRYDERIEVRRVVLHRVRLPFREPFKTSKGTLLRRELALVEIEDCEGRTGLGECVAFPTDWYLPETLGKDVAELRDVLAPALLNTALLHPREASQLFADLPGARALPMACGALEAAVWDLYGKIVGRPLWRLIGEEYARITPGAEVPAACASASARGSGVAVEAGAVIGLASPSQMAEAAKRCVDAGYTRIKLKIAPGGSVARVRAVQEVAPDAIITLDANQSFTERSMDELRALDRCGVAWIEEPLDVHRVAGGTSLDPFARLSRLQRSMNTPICLDESVARPGDLARALTYPELRCYAVKVGKMGGVQPTIEFMRLARHRGLQVWMGGMFETGVTRRVSAAFQTLPCVRVPGDIGATARYFTEDVTNPPYALDRGRVLLNSEGFESGLGCELDRAALQRVSVERIVVDRP